MAIRNVEHEHVYGRVPKLAGSWIACVECGDPYRGPRFVRLINQNIALKRRAERLERGWRHTLMVEMIPMNLEEAERWIETYVTSLAEEGGQADGKESLARFEQRIEDDLAQETPFARALRIAKVAHAGQKYGQQDYIEHPIRVAKAFDDPTLKIVALLHDVVEDSNVTVEEIQKHLGSVVADAIEAITRRGGTYHDYILFKVARNSLARKVKIADLQDNLEHIDKYPDWGFASLQPRYMKALMTLGHKEG